MIQGEFVTPEAGFQLNASAATVALLPGEQVVYGFRPLTGQL